MSQPPPLPAANPYAAPLARVDEYSSSGELVLADRGTRLLAAIVDGVILAGIAVAIGIVFAITIPLMSKGEKPSDAAIMLMVGVMSVAYLAVLIVNLVLMHRYGQTIAKRLFRIKVVRADGAPCSLARQVFARWFPVNMIAGVLNIIPFLGTLFWMIDSLLIFRDDQRCLHDLIADTIVVKA